MTTSPNDPGYQSKAEGTETGKWPMMKGQSGPLMDPYPPEYARLVGSWNNGTDSINKPMGPKPNFSTGKYGYDVKGKPYQEGGPGQPKVKEGP